MFLLVAMGIAGCASRPESRQVAAALARSIQFPSDQKIPHYNNDPRVYHLFARGTYHLIKEDDEAAYYANPGEEFRYKYLKPSSR